MPESFHKWRWRFLVLWILLFTATTIYSIGRIGQQVNRNNETRTALCAFKFDLSRRVDQSIEFLHTHPNGAFGISAAIIKTNIENQKKTLESLKVLHCKG